MSDVHLYTESINVVKKIFLSMDDKKERYSPELATLCPMIRPTGSKVPSTKLFPTPTPSLT